MAETLVLIDVDDVVLHHTKHLEPFLREIGFSLECPSGSSDAQLLDIRKCKFLDQEEADKVLEEGFKRFAGEQDPIEGAAEYITKMSTFSRIKFLSNVPSIAMEVRRNRLYELGLKFELIRNKGGKGRSVLDLENAHGCKTVFIDDSERQIVNVRKHAPKALTIRADLLGSSSHGKPLHSIADSIATTWLEIFKLVDRHVRESA